MLFDASDQNTECAVHGEASYVGEEGKEQTPGQITAWDARVELRSGAFALQDYNHESPNVDLLASKPTTQPVGGNDKLEVYQYPGMHQSGDEGEERARRLIEAEEAASQVIHGAGSCHDFSPGHLFSLRGHDRADFDGKYLLKEVRHRLQPAAGGGAYSNTFTCMPAATPFRPLCTMERPRIYGAQTAVVVGEQGNEIDVDEFGSVYLRFHWDRREKGLPSPTCRVRVSQGWAGQEWGAYFAPRIGQEVIVEFLDGDPNRPIVTGRVYNGANKPPYSNPEEGGVRSRSTQQGGADNYNEIRMVDTKGSELLAVQAEKDWQGQIKNDFSEDVGHDRTRSVGANESVSITEDQKITVGKDKTEEVTGDESLEVGKSRKRQVTDDETVEVGKAQKIRIGGERTLAVTKDHVISVEGDQKEDVSGDYSIEVRKAWNGSAKTITLTGKDEVRIKAGKAELLLEKNGNVTIKGAKIQLKASGDIVMQGKKVKQN